MELGEWAVGMKWLESGKIADHIPTEKEYDMGSIGRISNLMLDVRELQEPLLCAAALSLMSAERAGPLMYEEKCMCPYLNDL